MSDQIGDGTQEQAADSAANAPATAKKKEGFSWNKFPGMIGAIRKEIEKECGKILDMVSKALHHVVDQIDESFDQQIRTQSEIADHRHSETTDRMEILEGLLIETTEKISGLESQLATSQATLKETNLTIDQLRETSLRGALTAVNELKEEFTQQISGVSAKQEDLILRVLQDEKEIKEKIDGTETHITDWVQTHTSEKVSGAVDRVLEAIHFVENGLNIKLETLTQKHGNLVEQFLGSEAKIKESIKDLENRARQEVERVDGRVNENRQFVNEALEGLRSKIEDLTGKVEGHDGEIESICSKYALTADLETFKESVLGTLAEVFEANQVLARQTKEDHEKVIQEALALKGSWTDEEVQAMRTSLEEMRSDTRVTEALGKVLEAGNTMMDELRNSVDEKVQQATRDLSEVVEIMLAGFKEEHQQALQNQKEAFGSKVEQQNDLARGLKEDLGRSFNQFREDFGSRLAEAEEKLPVLAENLEFYKEGLSARVKTIDDQTATAVDDLRKQINSVADGQKEFPKDWKESVDERLRLAMGTLHKDGEKLDARISQVTELAETFARDIRKDFAEGLAKTKEDLIQIIDETKKESGASDRSLAETFTETAVELRELIWKVEKELGQTINDQEATIKSAQDEIRKQLEDKIAEARAAALTLFKSLEPLAQSIKDLETATKKEMGENKAEMAQQVEDAKHDLTNQTCILKNELAKQLVDAKNELVGQFNSLEQDIRQLMTATADKLAEFAILHDHLNGLLEKKHEAENRIKFTENMELAKITATELKVPEDWMPSGKNIIKDDEIKPDEMIEEELKTLTEVRKYIPEFIFARKDWDGTNRMAFTFLVKLEDKWYSVT